MNLHHFALLIAPLQECDHLEAAIRAFIRLSW